MRMGRRRRVLVAVAVVVVVVAAWVPTLIAQRYADGPGGVEVGSARVDRGWEFVYHVVRLSRGARLGSHDAALATARTVWAGPPAVAQDVDLVYQDGAFTVPVPPGGTVPPAARREARPASRLGWVVEGSVRGGPRQMIGLLDYRSGKVVWDIRDRAAGRAR
jgi:hypothetical protein